VLATDSCVCLRMLPTAAFIEYDVSLLNIPSMFLLVCLSVCCNLQRHPVRSVICPAALQDMRDAEDACRKLDGFKGWVCGKCSIHLEPSFDDILLLLSTCTKQ
jgi:hypothetical protein